MSGSHPWGALALPAAIMGGLYVLSSLPADPALLPASPALWLPPTVQNLLHLPAYGALAWAWRDALGRLGQPRGRGMWLAIAMSSAFGLLDEWHQAFVPGRFATGTDALLNLLGALIGAVLLPTRSRHGGDMGPRR